MRLNRYLARAGVASRRASDELIKAGRVTVNGTRGELNTFVASRDLFHQRNRQVRQVNEEKSFEANAGTARRGRDGSGWLRRAGDADCRPRPVE